MFSRYASRPTLTLIALLLLLGACAPLGANDFGHSAPTATPAQDIRPSHTATVTGIEFILLESFPLQIHAIVKGTMPDVCTMIQLAAAICGWIV